MYYGQSPVKTAQAFQVGGVCGSDRVRDGVVDVSVGGGLVAAGEAAGQVAAADEIGQGAGREAAGFGSGLAGVDDLAALRAVEQALQ